MLAIGSDRIAVTYHGIAHTLCGGSRGVGKEGGSEGVGWRCALRQYVSPSNYRGAVHDFALLYLGVHLFDNCDLEALADAAAARNRWEFLLTAAPLPVRGGTGSPLNPIATF
jgi:hypothetical protein